MSNIKKWLLVLVGVVLFVGMGMYGVSADNVKSESSTVTNNSEKMESQLKDNFESEALSRDIPDPIAADQHNAPSPDGIWFLLSVAGGLTTQPQSEQNIVINHKPIINGAATPGLVGGLLPSVLNFTIHRWHYADSKWIDDGSTKQFSEPVISLLGLGPTIPFDGENYISALDKSGTYCYQVEVKVPLLLGIGTAATYYSQFAYVNVSDVAVPATELQIDAPPVVFAGVTGLSSNDAQLQYEAKGSVRPAESTDSVEWEQSDEEVTYERTTGSDTKFSVTPELTSLKNGKINDRDNVAGIPVTLKAHAGSIIATRNVLVGGLPALRGSADKTLTWPVAGIDDLINISQGQMTNETYQWHFYNANGQEETDLEGVDNVKGTDISRLNSDNPLTIKAGAFMNNAQQATVEGNPYYAQLVITFQVGDNSNVITVNSNKAYLYVTSPPQELTLNNVPDFDFGLLSAIQLYQGDTVNSTNQSNNQLTITAQGVDNWDLTAERTAFFAQQTAVNEPILTLMDLPNQPNIPIKKDDDNENKKSTILTSDQANGQTSWTVGGQLTLPPNPQLQLANNQQLNSAITWTLNGPSPE